MNRQQRRTAAAQKRRDERRAELIALASNVIADMAEQDPTLPGATLILPSGEMMHLGGEGTHDPRQ